MAWFRDENSTVISDTRFREVCNDCRECYMKNNTSVPCHGDELSCHRYDFADASEYEKEIRAKAIEEFSEQIKARAHSMERNDWSANYMISIWESVIDKIAMELKGE